MVHFFRNNIKARNSVLWIVVTLFILGMGVNNFQSSQHGYIGKRQLNPANLKQQVEYLLKSNPDADPQAIYQAVLQSQIKKAQISQKLETSGLQPSPERLNKYISETLKLDHKDITNIAQQQKQTVSELIRTASDELAQEQMFSTLKDSVITIRADKSLHEHTLQQSRKYIDIELNPSNVNPTKNQLLTIYQAMADKPKHPPSIQYHAIDITPESLKLSPSSSNYNKRVEEISQYAYTHPTDLASLAKHYQLPVEKITTKAPADHVLMAIQDPDVSNEHYISDLLTISSENHQLIQVIAQTAAAEKTFEESKDELQEIYLQSQLRPMILGQLHQTQSLDEIHKICKKHGLEISHKTTSTDDPLASAVLSLTPTREQPHPSTTVEDSKSHWIQLRSIQHTNEEAPKSQLETLTHIVEKDSYMQLA